MVKKFKKSIGKEKELKREDISKVRGGLLRTTVARTT